MDNQNQQPNYQQNQQQQAQPPYQQPPYYQPNYMQDQQRPARPDNYLVWAILCTILCCLPLGIVSIVYSSKVDNLYNSGDYAGAQDASDKAKKFAKWGAIISVACVVLYILFIVIVGLMSGAVEEF